MEEGVGMVVGETAEVRGPKTVGGAKELSRGAVAFVEGSIHAQI